MTDEILEPWEEEPPDVPRDPQGGLIDLMPIQLVKDINRLALELDRAGRVLAVRISRSAKARADYQIAYDKKMMEIRVEGKRTAADERRALIHDRLADELYLNAEVSQGLVDSSRAYVRSLEGQLSAKQTQLRAVTTVDLLPRGLNGEGTADPGPTFGGRRAA